MDAASNSGQRFFFTVKRPVLGAEHQCAAASVHRIHGHRHQYAQVRYRELTGWAAPAAAGPRSKDMTADQRAVDREAWPKISAELGHEREQITVVYLGR